MQGIRYQYSKLYGDFVQDPELAKFRRYLDYWSWMLYNENWEIEQKIRECNEIVANIHSVPPTRSVYTLMDYPQTYIKKQDPTLEAKIEDLKKLIRRYGKDLTLAHAIANLPSQPEIWARHFSEYTEAFQDGRFGPTNEDATVYSQVPSHADTCSQSSLLASKRLLWSPMCSLASMFLYFLPHAALLILCVPTLKRSDMFAITGAFFAVGGIFVGARSMD